MTLYKSVPTISLLLGLFCCLTIPINGAKILLYPLDSGFNSRAINLAKLATYLQEDGHNVSIIMNKAILDKYNPDHLNIIRYDLPSDIIFADDQEIITQFEELMTNPLGVIDMFDFWGRFTSPFCDALLSYKDLVKELKAEQYDLFITDFVNECGRIISDYLDIPTILYTNHGFTINDFIYPRITSFVCDSIATFCSSDEMTFQQRLINFIFTFLHENLLYPKMLNHYQDIREKHNLNTSISISNPVRFSKSIIIANVDFVLDYPRPLMPHVFPISGLYIRDPNPLPKDLAVFIEGSKYKSIVVVSFGTLVDKVSSERAEIMARVFGKLPAIVIWRFTAVPPKALAENTKLVGWFPQYDVLAHPKTSLFVTHCGVSATFEAASLGIPVVALPMLADQRYHAIQLVTRLKMGNLANWAEFSEANFEDNVLNAFNNPVLTTNAKEAAELMNDRDIEPKQKFLHLVNFTIRHNGAEHLISKPGRELNTLQFYSVDVIGFLLLLLILIISALFFSIKLSLAYFKKGAIHKLKKN